MSDEELRKWRATEIQKIREQLAARGFINVEEEVYFAAFIANGIKLFVKNNNHYVIHLDESPRVEFLKK